MASSSPTKNICKFRLENNVFISATEEINASELEEYIVELVQSGILPHGTIFYLMGGIHHGLNSEEEVIPGMTDFKLLQGFYHKIYSCLIELDIWDQKKHDYILIISYPSLVLHSSTIRHWRKPMNLAKFPNESCQNWLENLEKERSHLSLCLHRASASTAL